METPAPLVISGGRIWTMDDDLPRVEALVIENGRITAAGTESTIGHQLPRDADRLDLHGRIALPGFIDAHTHLFHYGTDRLFRIDLGGTTSIPEALALVKERMRRGVDSRWVVAVDFDESRWAERRYPTKAELDSISDGRPLVLRRVDGHMAVANTPALHELAPESSPAWAAGILGREAIRALAEATRPSTGEMEAALGESLRRMLALGVTSVHDIVGERGVKLYRQRERSGSLPLRVALLVIAEEFPAVAVDVEGGEGPLRTPFLRFAGVKIWADGSLGARTAALMAPYADEPTTSGRLYQDSGALEAELERHATDGRATAVHAIGDRAVARVLAAHERLAADWAGAPHRIEHMEVVNEGLIARARTAGITASLQPNFVANWSMPGGMNWHRLGQQRGPWCDPLGSIHAAGIPIAFGSDTMPPSPLFGLQAALAHPVPEQRMNAVSAVAAYTRGGAESIGAGDELGRLAPGLWGDVVVLSGDPFTTPRIDRLSVEATIVGGVLRYRRIGEGTIEVAGAPSDGPEAP